MVLDTTASLVAPSSNMQINEQALGTYIQSQIPGFQAQDLHVFQFSHGQSNPTYLLKTSAGNFVLRKKPPPPTLPSAHAIEREYKVLRALSQTQVPVPKVLFLCEDTSIIGTPFYIMEHVKGRIFDDPSLPALLPAQRAVVYENMAYTLAAMHNVDPLAVGLQDYGRPTGYNARQVQRWGQQYLKSVSPAESPMPEMQRLIAQLKQRIPASDNDPSTTRISHGDFRLDNLVFSADREDHVLAVLDWELSTLGDPLADLAYNCMPYHLPSDIPSMVTLPFPLPPGIPDEQQYIEIYCRARQIPYPLQADWAFYLSLSIFRLASILAGVGARAKQGNASSRVAAAMGADSVVRSLACKALEILEGTSTASQAVYIGTPHEPYANPRHPSAQRDSTPNIMAGTPLEEYANPSDAWKQAAARSSEALKEADSKLPPTVNSISPSNSSDRKNSAHSSSFNNRTLAETSVGNSSMPGLGPSRRVQPILDKLKAFMNDKVFPAEEALNAHALSDVRWTIHPLQEQLKEEAKKQGLWNLWIPSDMARFLQPLVQSEASSHEEATLLLGPGLMNLEYAHCAEIMGQSVWAPECFNCSAPDTGNMEVLARYGNRTQQKKWLIGLMQGEFRSCFAMTEPAVASSDATNIQSSITRQGNEYVLNGRKWWISGACDPRCRVAIFMGKTDPSGPTHKQQSMILVPMNAPGVQVIRPLPVFGFDDAPHGHAEVLFTNVKVPSGNIILGEGRGFEIAQGRLGPGRLHHCMRLIGLGERAIQLMVARAKERTAFGKALGLHQSVRIDIANSRVELDAARLVVLNAAHALDMLGNKDARGKIAAAKALAPTAVLKIIDRAIQIHGGAGVGDTVPLAAMYAGARTLRLADGPDVVHLETIAKMELVPRRSKL